jgi:hypothetical protein
MKPPFGGFVKVCLLGLIIANVVWASDPTNRLPLCLQRILVASEAPREGAKTGGWAGVLPASLQRFLAKRFTSLRDARVDRLLAEVRELLPPDALSFMALLPQMSYSYLVMELPVTASVAKAMGAVEEIAGERSNDFRFRTGIVREAAQKKEWFGRLHRARRNLLEAQSLVDSQTPTDEARRTEIYLLLAVVEGFTYGFTDEIEKGRADWESLFIGAGQRERVTTAAQSFEKALSYFEEKTGHESQETILLCFLAGKNAVNAMRVFSHAGEYSYSGQKTVPDDAYYIYAKRAKELLTKVVQNLSPIVVSDMAFGPLHVLYFEAAYHLAKVLGLPAASPNAPDVVERGTFSTLEDLYRTLLATASPEWMQSQFGDRYSLMARLSCDVRWGHQHTPRRDALWQLQMDVAGNAQMTYADFTERMNTLMGYPRLQPEMRVTGQSKAE